MSRIAMNIPNTMIRNANSRRGLTRSDGGAMAGGAVPLPAFMVVEVDIDGSLAGWVELLRNPSSFNGCGDGFRCAQPILRLVVSARRRQPSGYRRGHRPTCPR